ncbi:MAG TPA: 2Fe-2S iron-sulfur cluster-binding protein [Burkholderiaceae bacterium]
MSTVHLLAGRSFEAAPDRTLLDAALDAGLHLEHSCRTGRCGTCKTRLLSGSVQTIAADTCLTSEDRAKGWILTCADAANGDVSLEAEDLARLAGLNARTLPARLDSIARLADDVVYVMLRLPPTAAFKFLPGQYINVIADGGLRRSYSLAEAPRADGKLELMIRRVDDGAMSAYWFDRAKPNDLLRIDGPRGSFFLRDVAGVDLCLLATGTGIAPIRALLTELVALPDAGQPRSVRLYWGGRTEQDLFWKPATEIDYVPVLSRADESWSGARGHVQDVLLTEGRDLANTQVYACGSPAMIDSAQASLTAAGLPARAFFSDAFVSSE